MACIFEVQINFVIFDVKNDFCIYGAENNLIIYDVKNNNSTILGPKKACKMPVVSLKCKPL